MIEYYQVHDFFPVSVSSRTGHIQEGYKHYFRHFQTNAAHDGKYIYRVHDFSAFQLPSIYKQYGPYISVVSGFFIPREKYAVIIRKEGIEEYTTYANRATNLWMQTFLVSQGISLVHGAGVGIGGKGVLFAGFGGVGKTLLIAELKKRDDFMFFGDDYVMVGRDGTMYAYPTDFSIYPYHVAAFPELEDTRFSNYLFWRKRIPLYYEFQRAANFFSRRFTRWGTPIFKGWNAPYVKVPAEVLVSKEKIGTREQLYACVFLTRAAVSVIHLEEISAEEFAAALTGNLQIEFQHAFPYLGALQAFGYFDTADFLAKQHAILKQGVSAVKRYRVAIPMNMNSATVTPAIVQQLEKIL